MSTETTTTNEEFDVEQLDLTELPDETVEELQDRLSSELERRSRDIDLDDATSAPLVNEQWVKWATLSAHANTKAVKPWILHVTEPHDEYRVDGEWLETQQIDGRFHMDISPLEEGDIIRVSGASHNNKKHRYYRVVAITPEELYGTVLKESEVIEAVG